MFTTVEHGNGPIRLSSQPEFPKCDLTDDNTAMVSEYMLSEEAGVGALAKLFASNQQGLASILLSSELIGSEALSPSELAAFCGGFATLEYLNTLVNPRRYNGLFAVRQTQRTLIGPNYFAKDFLEKRTDQWTDQRPNIFSVLATDSSKHNETMDQLRARLVGAQIACELQLPITV